MPTESNKSSQAAKGTRKIAPAEARSAFGPLGIDESLHRLEAGIEAGGDEILALAGEEPELLALPPRRELAKELQARIGGGGDHPGAPAPDRGRRAPRGRRLRPRARPSPGLRSRRTPPG